MHVSVRSIDGRVGVAASCAALFGVVTLFSGCAGPLALPPYAALSVAPSVSFRQIGVDEVRDSVSQTVANTNAFGATMLAASQDRNAVVSPMGAMVALSVIRAGAGGDTGAQLDRVLGRNDPTAVAALIGQVQALHGDPGAVDQSRPPSPPLFNQAPGIFVDHSMRVGSDYLRTLSEDFDTGVYPVDFATGQARSAINQWFAVNTDDSVDVPSALYDKGNRLSVGSAVFLAAAWSQPFVSIGDAEFTRADGATFDTRMMLSSGAFRSVSGPDFRAVELPLGGGLAMQVVIGDTDAPLSGIPVSVSQMFRGAAPILMSVQMPRFVASTATDLAEFLKDQGVKSLSSGSSDLDALHPGVSLSAAQASAALAVGENGVVTSDTNPAASSTPDGLRPPVTFAVDRPFYFQILDTATGLALYMGHVYSP